MLCIFSVFLSFLSWLPPNDFPCSQVMYILTFLPSPYLRAHRHVQGMRAFSPLGGRPSALSRMGMFPRTPNPRRQPKSLHRQRCLFEYGISAPQILSVTFSLLNISFPTGGRLGTWEPGIERLWVEYLPATELLCNQR